MLNNNDVIVFDGFACCSSYTRKKHNSLGDKKVFYWDKDSKQKLYTSETYQRQVGVGVFNDTGTLFAYVVQYDYSKGCYGEDENANADRIGIVIHQPLQEHIKNRGTPHYKSVLAQKHL